MSARCAHPQLPTASRDHIRRSSWQVRMAALQSFAAQRQRPSSPHGGRPARAGCGKKAPRRQGCSTARTRQRTRHRTTPGMRPRPPVRTEREAFSAGARRQLHPRVVPVRTGSSRSHGERSPSPTAFEAPRRTSRVRTKGTAARMRCARWQATSTRRSLHGTAACRDARARTQPVLSHWREQGRNQ